MQHRTDVEAADALKNAYNQIRSEIGKVIIGQDDVIKSVLISIFSNGHCLLVAVPGLAKTLLVQTVTFLVALPILTLFSICSTPALTVSVWV